MASGRTLLEPALIGYQPRRRDFLAALASLAWLPSASASPTRYPVHYRKANPFDSVLAHIEAGSDEFPFEKQAQEIESRLAAMLNGRPLPLAAGFRGVALVPKRYVPIGEGAAQAEFAEGEPDFAAWIKSLGTVRRARFFVLPDDIVRYEIASARSYRVGTWKQVWKDGKLESWRPLNETLATSAAPLFEDITGHSFAGVESFHEQLLKGNGWWRGRRHRQRWLG
jgi:hypothetical protein